MTLQRRDPLRMFEGGVFSALSPVVLTNQQLLPELSEQEAERFHLYAVCWRPRIRMVPVACHADAETLTLGFSVETPDGRDEWTATMTNIWRDAAIEITAEPPYTSFTFHLAGRPHFHQDAAWWLSQVAATAADASFDPSLFDLEVLYVGQAYGSDGERSARDRLVRHETLQQVYATANHESTHNVVSLVLLGMENPVQLVRMTGTQDSDDEQAIGEELFRLLNAAPSLQQRVNFTEAALIRYFRPPFNDKFKHVFPSREHTSYQECFDLDLNSVGFTLDALTTFGRLWSEHVPPARLHAKTYFLQSKRDRIDMFDFLAPRGDSAG